MIEKEDVDYYYNLFKNIIPELTQDQRVQAEEIFKHFINEIIDCREQLKSDVELIACSHDKKCKCVNDIKKLIDNVFGVEAKK